MIRFSHHHYRFDVVKAAEIKSNQIQSETTSHQQNDEHVNETTKKKMKKMTTIEWNEWKYVLRIHAYAMRRKLWSFRRIKSLRDANEYMYV